MSKANLSSPYSIGQKLAKTCPHDTRPRESGEWGKEVFTQQFSFLKTLLVENALVTVG